MKNKIFIPNPNEGWIIDRIINEFNSSKSSHQIVNNINEADIIWLHARYIWNHFPIDILKQKKVLMSYHHIVPEKFNKNEHIFCEQFVNAYWVPNIHTENFLKKYTNKPIHRLCYWINDEIFDMGLIENEKIYTNKKEPTEIYTNFKPLKSIPGHKIVLGSYQRDTEGSSIQKGQFKPKLEKGPDIFAEIVKKLNSIKKEYVPILTGYRRHFLAFEFFKNNIDWFHLGFLDENENMTKAYKILKRKENKDAFYIVSSRFEGGPQAILECAQLKIKILSTDVGIAKEILHKDCICKSIDEFVEKITNDKMNWNEILNYNFNNVQNYTLSKSIPKYDLLLSSLDSESP